MESIDYQINYQHRLFFCHKSATNKYIRLLLAILIVICPYQISFPAQATLAQDAIAQSPTLNKNQNIIYVNPQRGDDSQVGKKLSPLKTITKALEIATTGSTIQLTSGTYSEETGEKFPLIISNQITLKGNPSNQGYTTIIQGDGYFISPTAAGQNVTLVALKDATAITGVTVTNKHSRGHGLWIESANPEIVSNTFTRNGNTGVSVNGNSSPRIEDNYFYNNSGNGLLVYGTSNPEVVNNTFEQTGFGVSIVEQATAMLRKNLFDGNRIGIILEGSSQGVLRHNKIINSSESGLTAIAESLVDLGTDNEPGHNLFRSNRKIDIQNATSNQIPAVGTEVQGDIVGDINFDRGISIANNNNTDNTFKDLPPLPNRRNLADPPLPRLNLPAPSTLTETPSNLPAPPPVLETDTGNKELVFTPSSSYSTVVPNLEPVPFLPETKNTALNSNDSTIGSLSDVLGSSTSQVRYKVLVEALNADEEDEVRSLYPEAFKTIYQGESWLQVGAFSNWDKAKQAERTLVDLGLETYLVD